MAGTAAHRAAPADRIYQPAPRNRAAHRADPAPDNPANIPIVSLLNTEQIPVTESPYRAGRSRHRGRPAPIGGKKVGAFTVGAVTGTIMMIQMGFTPTGETPQIASAEAAPPAPDQLVILADPEAVLTRERPQVITEAAPPPIIVAPPVAAIVPIPPRPAAPPVAPAPAVVAPASAPAPAALPVSTSSRREQIAAAARAQLGMVQDCVAMTARALRSVGINLYDWPVGYLSLGPRVSYDQALPGDVIYYADGGAGVAHVAIYVGNGMAVHGGFNGNQTVLFSAFVGSGPVFVRVA